MFLAYVLGTLFVSVYVCLRRRFDSVLFSLFVFFFKQKTAYEMRISDWSSDVCSSDLLATNGLSGRFHRPAAAPMPAPSADICLTCRPIRRQGRAMTDASTAADTSPDQAPVSAKEEAVDTIRFLALLAIAVLIFRSEEHTSELQSLMRISYAVFFLTK